MSVLLCACPYSSPYALDETPSIYVEDNLLGKWATFVKKSNSDTEEPVKLILSKKNDTEYNIAFTGYIDELIKYNLVKSDSISGTAFMSTVDENQFLNINIKGVIYIAELKVKNETLSLMPLVEHFTAKLVHDNQGLRNAVSYHYKTRVHPMVDEDFCLKNMVRVN